jgi:hydrogenase/urease accessory protein HupE
MSSGSRLRGAALLLIAWGWLVTSVSAHPAPYSYLDLRLTRNELEVRLVAHALDLAHELNVTPPEALLNPQLAELKRDALLALLRPRLSLVGDGRPIDLELLRVEPVPDQQALALYFRHQAQSLPGALKIRCHLFPYDPQHQTFLNIYEDGALVHQEILNKDHQTLDYFTGGREGAWAAVRKFIPSGIYHIFTGPDHILFIIGLLLLGGSLPRLLTIVTAFTVAHSVTLSLAALDIYNPPARLIEPAIALSIIYIGIDNLTVGKGGRDVRAWIAFFFGFLHGFGFAGVLREFGLPSQALGWSLFSFNVGVEIGQVCIVVVAATILAQLRRRRPKLSQRVTTIGSAGVILAGSYWFIQRVFF